MFDLEPLTKFDLEDQMNLFGNRIEHMNYSDIEAEAGDIGCKACWTEGRDKQTNNAFYFVQPNKMGDMTY